MAKKTHEGPLATEKLCPGCGIVKSVVLGYRVRLHRGKYVRASRCKACESKAAGVAKKRNMAKMRAGEMKPYPSISSQDPFGNFVLGGTPIYRRVYSPLTWPTNLEHLLTELYQFFPVGQQVRGYREVFGGPISALLSLPRYPNEMVNDVDQGVVNFFEVVSDPEKFEMLRTKLSLTPYSRALYENLLEQSRIEVEDDDRGMAYLWPEDDIEWAWAFFILARQSIKNKMGFGWAYSQRTTERAQTAIPVASWLSTIEHLPEVHKRLIGVQFESLDFRLLFDRYDAQKSLFFCDPPQFKLGRTSPSERYYFSMTKQDHRDLVERLLKLKGMAILLCDFDEGLHQPLLEDDWLRHDIVRAPRNGKTGPKTVATVLVNHRTQVQLKRERRSPEFKQWDMTAEAADERRRIDELKEKTANA